MNIYKGIYLNEYYMKIDICGDKQIFLHQGLPEL